MFFNVEFPLTEVGLDRQRASLPAASDNTDGNSAAVYNSIGKRE